MFYLALLFLIVLGILVLLIVGLNIEEFTTTVHLQFFTVHLPGLPVLLVCLVFTFMGALLLYVFAARGARRDVLEMKVLRMRIEDLEKLPARVSSGGLSAPQGGSSANFAPPVVPMPGFGGVSGAGSSTGAPGNSAGPAPSIPPNQWQPPGNPLQNASPSSSNTIALPPRLLSPQQQPPQPPQPQQQQPPQQMGGPRPPFQRS